MRRSGLKRPPLRCWLRGSEALAHEEGGLRVVIVSIARLVATLFVEGDGGLQVVVGIEVDAAEFQVARMILQGVEEECGDAAAAGGGADIEALTLAGVRDGGEVAQDDAADDFVVQFREPHGGCGFGQEGVQVAGPVALDDMDGFVVLLENFEGVAGIDEALYRDWRFWWIGENGVGSLQGSDEVLAKIWFDGVEDGGDVAVGGFVQVGCGALASGGEGKEFFAGVGG